MNNVIKFSEFYKNSTFAESQCILFQELMKIKENYDKYKDNIYLSVNIDTDDDFSVNGTANFSSHIVIKDSTNVCSEVIEYLESLSFTPEDNWKVKNFKDMFQHIKQDLEFFHNVDIGGNQTLRIFSEEYPNQVKFGELVFDLSL